MRILVFFFFLNQTQFSIQLEKKVKHVRLLRIFVKRNTAKGKIKMRLEKKKMDFEPLGAPQIIHLFKQSLWERKMVLGK